VIEPEKLNGEMNEATLSKERS